MKGIILAAGKGKRLLSEKSDMPKVLRRVNGKPMLLYVIENLSLCDELILVAGYKKEQVIRETNNDYKYVIQHEQKGTGHAVLVCNDALKDYKGDTLVTYGDMPLISSETYKSMHELHRREDSCCTVLTCIFPEDEQLPHYGRIIRDADKNFLRITEHKDCDSDEKKIREVNVGVMICDNQKMFECLKEIGCDNAQGEYYLTDLPALMMQKGYKITVFPTEDINEIHGANTMEDLNRIETILKRRSNNDND